MSGLEAVSRAARDPNPPGVRGGIGRALQSRTGRLSTTGRVGDSLSAYSA